MLKGIPTEISPELLYALAETGHGDLVVIADDFYPPISKTPNGKRIYAKGMSAPQIIDAVLKLFPLDVDFAEHPIEYMVPDKGGPVQYDEMLPVWKKGIEALVNNGYDAKYMGEIERTKFYEKAGGAVLTICTSERMAYGCFMMQKGVL